MRDALVKAARVADRSLAEEIEDRLARTLWEDHDKSEQERRLDIIAHQVRDLVRELWASAGTGAIDPPDPLVLTDHGLEAARTRTEQRDHETGGQSRRAMRIERGEAPRILPVEISITRADDGTVVLVTRHGGRVIAETPIDRGTAERLSQELLAAANAAEGQVEPKPRPKSRRAR